MIPEFTAQKVEPSMWKVKRSPSLPAEPAFQHPDRCLHCGHLASEHHEAVGCFSEGGSKYIEQEDGIGKHVCSCLLMVAVPEIKETPNEEQF